jgi:hypothetical protein
MRTIFAAVRRWIEGERGAEVMEMERVTIPTTRPPREPVIEQMLVDLGIPHRQWRDIAKEADDAVARGVAPGRVTLSGPHNTPTFGSYSHAVEATCDRYRWMREIETSNAASVYEARKDDCAGGWGDEESLGRARMAFERLRDRDRRIEQRWAVVTYASLSVQHLFATLEVMVLEPDPAIIRYSPVELPEPPGLSRHPMREQTDYDVARKTLLRQNLRENALRHQPTRWTTAQAGLRDIETRIARWRADHEMLAAMIVADGDRGRVNW